MQPFEWLVSTRNSVANIPDRAEPGVYAIFAKNRDCLLPIAIPASGLIYVGLATDLESRNHFKAQSSGFHSPRRSIGAILKSQLELRAIPRSRGRSDSNWQSYKFEPDGEYRLTEWMNANLEYAIYPYVGDIRVLEKSLIHENEPPINLTGWKNPQKKQIQSLRNECKAEAKLLWNAC